jgi:hypothetical protein
MLAMLLLFLWRSFFFVMRGFLMLLLARSCRAGIIWVSTWAGGFLALSGRARLRLVFVS